MTKDLMHALTDQLRLSVGTDDPDESGSKLAKN